MEKEPTLSQKVQELLEILKKSEAEATRCEYCKHNQASFYIHFPPAPVLRVCQICCSVLENAEDVGGDPDRENLLLYDFIKNCNTE